MQKSTGNITNTHTQKTRLAICILSTLSLPVQCPPWAGLLLKANNVTVATQF